MRSPGRRNNSAALCVLGASAVKRFSSPEFAQRQARRTEEIRAEVQRAAGGPA